MFATGVVAFLGGLGAETDEEGGGTTEPKAEDMAKEFR